MDVEEIKPQKDLGINRKQYLGHHRFPLCDGGKYISSIFRVVRFQCCFLSLAIRKVLPHFAEYACVTISAGF